MQALESSRNAASARSEHLTELKFSEFSLTPELHHGIADAGFTFCTPIQSKTLPLALTGRDVAGQAQTGTGKTAAYLIALYQYLLTHDPLDAAQPGPRALIVAPTRELAVQIHSDAALLAAHLPFKLGLAFGGTDYDKQRQQLSEGVDVLIGTPGRLIDFFKQGVFGLSRVQVAVLDEADRMFDLGFLRDIRYILRRLPPPSQRLNLLFSATLSYRVLELAYEHMNDPELVRIEPDKLTVDRVRQLIYFPSNEDKLPLLVTLLREMDAKRTMVFVNRRRGAEYLREALERNGIQAEALSGDVPQRKRLKLMRDFLAGDLPVLIATDVASRGLHIPDVSHVFNYDLPQDSEDYVHRVGRTARAGASGDAISFGCEDYVVSLPDIERYIGRKIEVGSYDHTQLVDVTLPVASRPKRAERYDGRGGREERSSRRGPPPRRRDRDADRGARHESVSADSGTSEGSAPVQSEGTVDRTQPDGEQRERNDGPRRERGDGERRRRRRGKRPGRSGASAGAERAADGAKPSVEPDSGRQDTHAAAERESAADSAHTPSDSTVSTAEAAADASQHATDAPQQKKRRRRRGKRRSKGRSDLHGGAHGGGNGGAPADDRDAPADVGAGSGADVGARSGTSQAPASREHAEREHDGEASRERNRRPRRSRPRAGTAPRTAPAAEEPRSGPDERRHAPAEPRSTPPEPRRAPAEAHGERGSERDGSAGQQQGLLARLWAAIRR